MIFAIFETLNMAGHYKFSGDLESGVGSISLTFLGEKSREIFYKTIFEHEC